MAIARGCLVGLLLALPAFAAAAQPVGEGVDPTITPDADLTFGDRPSRTIVSTVFLGVQTNPAYYGSDDVIVGPSFRAGVVSLDFANFDYGNPEFSGDPRQKRNGFGYGLSFRYVGPRDSGEYSEIEGLDDIDPTLEVGFGAGYAWPNFEALGDVRYGIGGSDAWVGEVRAYYVARPTDRLALRVGPRLLFGTENYVDTYFGVSAEESANSGLDRFDPDPGMVSAAVELIATYRIAEKWWLEGGAMWTHFTGDAADSPFVTNGESYYTEFRIGFRRSFAIRF